MTILVKVNNANFRYHKMHPYFDAISIISPSFQNLVVGCAAGSSVLAAMNPLWVAKTRLCLQYENEGPKKYRGMIHCLTKILKDEGIKGWYKVSSCFPPG